MVVVYNPRSGSALKAHELRAEIESTGISVEKMLQVSVNLDRDLLPYLDQTDIIIAGYGGDGTLSRIANILCSKIAVFAPLPGGTLNHFTKDLDIPQELSAALKNLRTAAPKKIDVARVNGRVFINNSSIGLYPSTLRRRDRIRKKFYSKWLSAAIAGFQALVRYKTYAVEIDGETFVTPFVFVGNNDYRLENNLIGRRDKLNHGLLSIYAVKAQSRYSLFKALVRTMSGKASGSHEVKIWKVPSMTIRTKKASVRLSRDGEYERYTPPLRYEIAAKALTVIC